MKLIFFLFVFPLLAFAQPDTLWTRTFDSGGDDYADEVLPAHGGFLIASSAVTGSVDFRLTHTDGNGNQLWSRNYGTPQDDWCAALVTAASGNGWLMTGFTFPPASFYPDIFLVRVNNSGDTLWTRAIGDSAASESAGAILSLADGSFLITGNIDVSLAGLTDIYLTLISSSGDVLWTRVYEYLEIESATSICLLNDGNYLIGGSRLAGAGTVDFYFVKVNTSGDTLWTRAYGGEGYDLVYDLVPLADGGVVFTGLTTSFGEEGDLYLSKLNSSGDSVWAHTYGGPSEDHSHQVAPTSDGGFLVFGHTDSPPAVGGDAYLVKTDSEGNTQWTYTNGGPDYDSFESAQQTSDGGVILVGNRSGVNFADMFLVRLDQIQAADEERTAVRRYELMQNYPNPFNAGTSISFDLPKAGDVSLTIHNLSGQQVAVLLNEVMPSGRHTVNFDGEHLSSGIYIYRLEYAGFASQRKMVLIK